jgi:glycogen debranching enzyme
LSKKILHYTNDPLAWITLTIKKGVKMSENSILSQQSLERTQRELEHTDGIQASNWHLFKGAVFGRDSARVALDLIDVKRSPELVEKIIASLIYCQGTTLDPITGEEPGRIHHEHRRLTEEGMDDGAKKLFWALAEQWGQTELAKEKQDIINYASVDAAPQFVRLVEKYCQWKGPEILQKVFPQRNGGSQTLQRSVLNALDWVLSRINASDLGLLERLPGSIVFKLWETMRDGSVSYLHDNGTLGNNQAPFASVEVQGLAYDALIAGAKLFPEHLDNSSWEQTAKALQAQTLKYFYLADDHFFAQAIDRDYHGRPRPMRTRTSLPVELLETGILENLPGQFDQQKLVSELVSPMFSREFLTPVGVRMRSLRHKDLVPGYADYQGSLVSWAACTNVFAVGLRRYGLPLLAEDMERRILAGIEKTNKFVEFWYTMEDGRVDYTSFKSFSPEVEPETITGVNIPEATQAWTWSAAVRAKASILEHRVGAMEPWQQTLTAKCFADALQNEDFDLPESVFRINTKAGQQTEYDFIKKAAKHLTNLAT